MTHSNQNNHSKAISRYTKKDTRQINFARSTEILMESTLDLNKQSSVKGMAQDARDARTSPVWREIEQHFHQLHAPAFGKPFSAVEVDASPGGDHIAFTGATWDKLEGLPGSNIYILSRSTGVTKVITAGSHNDRQPKWSADGEYLAFLSDRQEKGCFQLYVQQGAFGEALRASTLNGTAEYISWSPTGNMILIGVAGRGAAKSGVDGSGAMGLNAEKSMPDWIPEVQGSANPETYRTVWVYDVVSAELRQVGRGGLNVWEACWCGTDEVAAVVSENPAEGAWYDATLAFIPIRAQGEPGHERIIYRGKRQLALPVASPSGAFVAILHGACSDRGVMAGDALLVDVRNGAVTTLDTDGVDATQLKWRDEGRLFYIGVCGVKTVAGDIDIAHNKAHPYWTTAETCGYVYPEACVLDDDSFVVVGESWTRYPEIAIIEGGHYQTIATLDHDGAAWIRSKLGPIEEVRWKAPDGLEIEGLLLQPNAGTKPHPLVLNIHGGPVWAFRNKWLMFGAGHIALLVARGYAVLCPNPRGSGGRGQDFAERVLGDVGGADTDDYLSGIDYLVGQGVADPTRLGVIGGSYGGYMASWLVTQTTRFAAAVPIAPVSDWVSLHTTTNIPEFCALSLDGKPYVSDGLYVKRSPLRFASCCKTPTLQISGAEDRCTPPTQALQFHRALLEHGTKSVLVTYPNEGHGVRKFPAYIYFCYRIVSWLEEHMPVSSQ